MSKTRKQSKRKALPAQASAPDDPLLEAWEKTLRENGKRAAVFNVRGKVEHTFAQIETRAGEIVREFDPFSAGEVIAIQIGNHADWPSLFLACLRKSLVALPLERTISDDQRRAVFASCGVVAVAVLSDKGVTLESALSLRTPAATMKPEAFWAGNRPSLLKLTSGTTAAPRAVRFRSEQLLADCENICATMGISERDLNFGVISISHSYGFSNLLTPLIARGVPLALSNDRMPRAILDGIAATGATVFPGMPVFYQSFCELGDAPPLPKLRLCISAGAPLSLQLADAFRQKCGRAIHSFYGSSECGGICYVRKANGAPGLVGPAMRGVKIDPLNARSNSSRIRVRSRAVGDGYFPEPDETKLGHGRFTPDDLLEKTPQGYRIVGRISDLINVAGKKVSPAQVEAEILRCAGVREVVVFARNSVRRNQEVAACVIAAHAVRESELLAHCRARLSSWQIPRRIFFVERMPVNERGKISRRELARMYATEDFLPRGSS
jgi:long-chain acyl-CoA synthetase